MRQHIDDATVTTQFIRSDLEALGVNPRTRQTLESLPDSRDTIVQSVNGLIDDTNAIEGEPLLTFGVPTAPILTNTRKLTGGTNVTATVGATEVDLDLSDTGVTAAPYGAATKLVVLAIDAKGRITSASEVDLNSDNVTEGTTHLFYTDARARAALSGGSGINYNSTSGAIATTGFSGTGVYTNFTFVDGICTAAS